MVLEYYTDVKMVEEDSMSKILTSKLTTTQQGVDTCSVVVGERLTIV